MGSLRGPVADRGAGLREVYMINAGEFEANTFGAGVQA
jgi:hypothetical protein